MTHHQICLAGSLVFLALTACSPGGGDSSNLPGRPDKKPPATPLSLQVQASRGRSTLTWSPAEGASGYRIYWSHTSIVNTAAANMIEVASSPYVHVGLTNESNYHYVVGAFNSGGEGPATSEVSTMPSAAYEPTWAEIAPLSSTSLEYDSSKSSQQNGQALKDAIQDLVAGEHLEIATGTYSVDSIFNVDVNGTSGAPIWIVAKPGSTPVITRPNASQNTINIGKNGGASYLCLRGLEFTGGSTAIKIYGCSQLWIDQCHVHDCGGAGIAANSEDTDNLYLTGNHIHDTAGTAEGILLGENNGASVTRDSVIAQNHIHDCAGTQGDGIEIKQGSYGNWVVENVIHDCQYPCIMVYGTGGEAPNVLERNICYRSEDNVMQVQGEAIVRNNLLMSGYYGFQSHDHQGQSRDLVFVHNTIITTGRGANLSSWNNRTGMVFANNVVYSKTGDAIRFSGGSTGVQVMGNVVLGSVTGSGAASYAGQGLADFRNVAWGGSLRDAIPISTSVIRGSADPTWVTDRDVRGHVRAASVESGCFDGLPQ